MTRKQFLRLLGFGVVAASLPKLPVAEAVEVAELPPPLTADRVRALEHFKAMYPPLYIDARTGLDLRTIRIPPHPEMKR